MYKFSEQIMRMDDKTWARHANPWSVYTRFSALPLLALSIWSRYWLGVDALFPFGLSVLWIWLNPRLFKPPKNFDSWASKGVLGEQLFLNRQTLPLPKHHLKAAHILTFISALGACVMMYGLWKYHLAFTLIGMLVAIGAKAWFFHHMVLLFEEDRDNRSGKSENTPSTPIS